MSENDNFIQFKGDGDNESGESRETDEKTSIEKYQDIHGLTLRKLNIGLWYIEHKSVLRKILIAFLLLAAAVSWSYTIYGFAYYFSRGMAEDELLARQTATTGIINHNAILAAAAKDLSLSPVEILKSGGKKYDFFVKARNPNKRRAAEFDYYFAIGDKKTEKRKGFIFPNETKYLLSLSNELDFRPAAAKIKFENFRWIRIDRREIPDWKSYERERLNIKISGARFVAAAKSAPAEKTKLNYLEFTARNETDYNYWSVDFIILLRRAGKIIGVNQYRIDEFMSGQTRAATVSWPGAIGRFDKIEIIPEINIMRKDIYIKYKGGAGEKK